ncbi:MAG: aspartate kinase [Thermoplasmata archaeon]
MTRKAPVVLKFGGASLSDPKRIAAHVRAAREAGAPVVLVASARLGVTDELLSALAHPRARQAHQRIFDRIVAAHPELPAAGRLHVERLRRLLLEVERSYPRDRPLADRVLSQGERLAVCWLSARLREHELPAVPVESDHLGLITDNAYGASCILFDRSTPAVRVNLRRIISRGQLPVVTGYFGRSMEGRVATLGRGGSDYSAAGIGALIGASRVELVKRNVSVLTADPRLVPSARPIARLSYEEAEELAQFGARVLHPLTIEPARANRILLQVRALDVADSVTTIGPARQGGGIRALTILTPLRLLRIRVPGGRQRPGVVSEVSARLAGAKVNLVQLFTSSALLCLLLEPRSGGAARRALSPLTAEAAVAVDGPYPVALVTAIGDGVLREISRIPPEVSRRILGFSATPRALSLAVPQTYGRRALRALHRTLVERESP